MASSGTRNGQMDSLQKRMREVGLREADIVEKFIRSGGKGGQNVNKTSTCVYLKHVPTGIEVKCRRERSQAQNRLTALRLLADKVEKAAEQEQMKKVQLREKARRRNRPRPVGLKEDILKTKKRVAEKKKLRAKRFED